MERRNFLAGITTAGIGGVAGCSGSSSPEMEFQSFIVPDPAAVSVDRNRNEFVGEIHNRRDEGSIKAELWFFRDHTVPDPEEPSQFDNGDGRQFQVARSEFFSANERREITIRAQRDFPEQWEYGIMPWPASHGAVFRNTGGIGEVEIRFEFRDTLEYDLQEPPTQLESVGEDGTTQSVFNVIVPPQVEYEIVAEPA